MAEYGDEQIFDILGFYWDRKKLPSSLPVHSVQRVCFNLHRLLHEFVHNVAYLEGVDFTSDDVINLIAGVTAGGYKISEHEQVVNIIRGFKKLLHLVQNNHFILSKEIFSAMHYVVAQNQSKDWGFFRGEINNNNYPQNQEKITKPKFIQKFFKDRNLEQKLETNLNPEAYHNSIEPQNFDSKMIYSLPTKQNDIELKKLFVSGVAALNNIKLPFERAVAFFLFAATKKFFFDCNKRAAIFMMNGILLSSGNNAINIPASRSKEFSAMLIEFYSSRDATGIFQFFKECHDLLLE